ncbi:MAG: hypothetical protein MI725_04375, partial [Pirellulales bacterium]|nr:hypothetical protein [Pirellulales bacterium]
HQACFQTLECQPGFLMRGSGGLIDGLSLIFQGLETKGSHLGTSQERNASGNHNACAQTYMRFVSAKGGRRVKGER